MFRVRTLTVNRFRGLAAQAVLQFGDRYHLIVGDNGAGKTNLLKLLAMVTRLDFAPLADESFDLAWDGVFDDGTRITGRVSREIGEGEGGREGLPGRMEPVVRWNWALTLREGEVETVVANEGQGSSGDAMDPTGAPVPRAFRPAAGEPWTLKHLRLHLAQSSRADEALGCFAALTEGKQEEPVTAVPPLEISVVRWGDGRRMALVGRNAIVGEAFESSFTERGATLGRGSLAWLDGAAVELEADSVNLRPRLERTKPLGDVQGALITETEYLGGDLEISFSPRVAVHHSKLSFGQKRLLGLRYYLSTIADAPAIIDELSNGLHHRWVESLIAELESRQSFLATQNPLVMDSVWWDSAEQAQQGIVLCTRNAEHRWVWRQLTAEEGVRFYEAWRAGIQQIHEVLKTESWW